MFEKLNDEIREEIYRRLKEINLIKIFLLILGRRIVFLMDVDLGSRFLRFGLRRRLFIVVVNFLEMFEENIDV